MSITSQVAKSGPFLVTGLPQTIPTGFAFQQGSDLLVLDTGPASGPYDPAHVLVLGSDYSVTGGGYNAANQMQSGSVVVVSGGGQAVAVNDYIVIERAAPLNQTTGLVTTGPLTATLIEQALDKQATLSQDLAASQTLALQFEDFEFGSGTLPLSQRAGMVLGFNSLGQVQYYTPTAFSPATLGNVVESGADPTGVADSTAAFQAAANKAQGLYLPPGTYLISGTITLPLTYLTKFAVRGAGTSCCKISFTGTGLLFAGSTRGGITCTGINFVKSGSAGASVCLNMNAMEQSDVYDNAINGFGTGIAMGTVTAGDAYFNHIHDNYFVNCGTQGVILGNTSTNPCNQNWIRNNKFDSCGTYGIYAPGGAGGPYACDFSYNNFEGSTLTGLYVNGNDNIIIGCHYELGANTAINIAGGNYNTIILSNTAGGTGVITDNGTHTVRIDPRQNATSLPNNVSLGPLTLGGTSAGTVTLTSGGGTITSALIATTSVVVLSLVTSSGTPGTYTPLTKANNGSATITGLSTDNSTYNWRVIN